jgi:hypothetical protein
MMSFIAALNESVSRYTQTEQGQVDTDLASFVVWVSANPPAEVAPVKGEPRDPTSATGQVWKYLDTLVQDKIVFTRKGACDALIGAGLNAATVATQYQRWAKTRGYTAPAPAEALPKPEPKQVVAVPPTVHHKAAPQS